METFIGVGGAGNNAISRLVRNEVKGNFIAIDEDKELLKVLNQKIRTIHSSNISDKLSVEGTVFIIAGMGGKAGSELAPEVAKRVRPNTVIGIAILPFKTEKTRIRAEQSLKAFKEQADTVIIIDNTKFLKYVKEDSTNKAFNKIDEMAYDLLLSNFI